ncbi:MAG: hypothetical protein ACRDS9_07340, partial [Pseudonocardiaceae bacterium]
TCSGVLGVPGGDWRAAHAAMRSAITALSRPLDFLRQRAQYPAGTAVSSTVLASDMGDDFLLEGWRDGLSPVILEDPGAIDRAGPPRREMTSLAMRRMESSASVAEQQNYAECLIAVG